MTAWSRATVSRGGLLLKYAFGLTALLVCGVIISAQQPVAPKTQLKVGDPAPDFTLMDNNHSQVRLSDFKGKKNVVLAFYVLAFTGG